jgi:hypothetical protein
MLSDGSGRNQIRVKYRVSDSANWTFVEAENANLKRMYADLALENTGIKDVLSRKLSRCRPSGKRSGS